MELLALFWTSFASATLLPGGSEALLLYLLNQKLNVFLLLSSATFGNTLGSFTNYLLGKYAVDFALSKKYISQKSLNKATTLFDKYGAYTLLLSWLPIIGDPLTLVAGVAHYKWWKFLMIVCFAKMARYIFVYVGFLAIG